MGKHSKAHFCVNKTETDEILEYGGWGLYSMVRLWIFSIALIVEGKQDIEVQWLCY